MYTLVAKQLQLSTIYVYNAHMKYNHVCYIAIFTVTYTYSVCHKVLSGGVDAWYSAGFVRSSPTGGYVLNLSYSLGDSKSSSHFETGGFTT